MKETTFYNDLREDLSVTTHESVYMMNECSFFTEESRVERKKGRKKESRNKGSNKGRKKTSDRKKRVREAESQPHTV